uniref:ShKT domain-containing protein n=1 Tax=Anabas testudineus TaxID=64144 RepID=A0A3Q1HI20_ANATE
STLLPPTGCVCMFLCVCVCVCAELCPDNTVIQAEIVDQHNAFRRGVKPPASNMVKMVGVTDNTVKVAQAWVDQCILNHGPPSTRYQLGENLFYAFEPYAWKDVVDAWHSEVVHYTYPNGSADGQSIGHYTQVVWNTSYKVGCGMTLCSNVYYYGCHYYRAGNFRRWPPYEVGPPCGSCPNACEDNLCTNPCPYIDHFINCPTLARTTGCRNWLVYAWCPASCKCIENEIIPIGKR